MEQPAVSAQRDWKQLLGLVSRREDEQTLLTELLGRICLEVGLEAAAIYSLDPQSSGFLLQAFNGPDRFPERVDGKGPYDWSMLELPDSLLLFKAAAGNADLEGPLLVALVAALKTATLRSRLKRQRFQVNYRGVELEALYDVGLSIASTLNLDQLGDEILLRAVSLLDARRGAFYLTSSGSYVLDRTFGGDAKARIHLDDLQVADLINSLPSNGQDLLPDALHLMAVPIGPSSKPSGLLVVGDKESRSGVGPFPDADRRTLSLFANQASIALENARQHKHALEKQRLEREVELAADIQRRLLPVTFPDVEGWEFVGWNRPARHVGGDYYDVLELPEGNIVAVLADVSGKGMPASLMVSTVHSALRLLMDQGPIGSDLMQRLNHHIVDTSAPNKFITLLLAQLDPDSGRIEYVNAGHNPGLLIRSGGGVEELEANGMPLGLFSGGSYEGRVLTMAPGDLLCIYSDGITECESPEEEEFGTERLIDLLSTVADQSLSKVVRSVDRAVTDFARGLSQGDDQTLVLVRRSLV